MRLYRHDAVHEGERGLLCRQSRLAGVVRLIVWCCVLAIPAIFGWKLDKPWLLWIFVAVAAVAIPMAVLELAAQFRATNWLLRIRTDGVWINLLSYRDRKIVPDSPSVVRLGYDEIASVGRHTETYSTPSEPGSLACTVWNDEFLEIELAHDQTGELKNALNDLRFPPAPAPAEPPQTRGHGRVSPMWFVNPSLLRIAWNNGHGPVIAPRLAQALSRLETYVHVAEPTRRERPKWRDLTKEEAIDLARELVQVHGATFAATDLVARVCGISHGEASTQVQQFEDWERDASGGVNEPARLPIP